MESGQVATWDEVEAWHHANETSRRRVVGLVIETRPDLVTPDSARTMRRLGCTKVQMGIQSLDDAVLAANERLVSRQRIAQAFAVLRAFGFKVHVHFMVNLLGSTPEADKADYLQLVTNPHFCPDEVKLYPCVLVESSRLMRAYGQRLWRPYEEDELVDVLVCDTLATPAYTRISRMIRDISACDIVAGNKKTNLRQMVEAKLEDRTSEVREIRMREVATADVALSDLHLDCVCYETANTEERFLQWVTDEGKIAGFCRLSLPSAQTPPSEQPTPPHTAMIREVHVYGRVAGLGTSAQGGAQHAGLGKALVEEACTLAAQAGYERVAVISAVGTRAYYRSLDFADTGLYQTRPLER
jgi:elongator complex protein 3